MKEKVMQGKPYAGNPHVRFDEGAGAPKRSGRSALLYNRKLTALWFLIGLGSSLQLASSLSISELIVLIFAPLLFFRDYYYMKNDGVGMFFFLSLFVILGCLISCSVNHTYFQFALRGLATCCLIPCVIVFSHWIIRCDPNGFKWFFVGAAISTVLCIFVFQRRTELTMYGNTAAEIMSGPLFWYERLKVWLLLPTTGWYLCVPIFVSATLQSFVAIFALVMSSSGRAAALYSISATGMILLGGRSRRTMMRITKHFWALIIFVVIGLMTIQFAYRISASRGWLGEKAQTKYELQTRGEDSVMRLILGGRADAFIGLLAARDKPIVGWGPWAQDDGGRYRKEFLSKYGTSDDYEDFLKYEKGGYLEMRLNLISCHSHITQFWVWYGIFGLVFILYAVFVLVRFLRQDVYVVPQWYFWLACGIPAIMWHIFFSPFVHRVTFPMMIVACLMARAVHKGKFQLPYDMIKEIEKAERT